VFRFCSHEMVWCILSWLQNNSVQSLANCCIMWELQYSTMSTHRRQGPVDWRLFIQEERRVNKWTCNSLQVLATNLHHKETCRLVLSGLAKHCHQKLWAKVMALWCISYWLSLVGSYLAVISGWLVSSELCTQIHKKLCTIGHFQQVWLSFFYLLSQCDSMSV
jgi:hypothetical protein